MWRRTTNSSFGTEVWVHPAPGGCWYWTPRWGYVLVDSVWFNVYQGQDYERGPLGAPIRGLISLTEFSSPPNPGAQWNSTGYWCEGGAIYSMKPFGLVSTALGQWGQRG